MSTGTTRAIALWDGRATTTDGWQAHAATGAVALLACDGAPPSAALRFDCRLSGHGSWAIVRHEQPFTLPEHYVVVLRIRGTLPPTELQVKLIDPSGANVWWWRLRPHTFTAAAQDLVLRRASLAFAWGPASGGDPRHVAAVEVAVAADDDRAGTLWVDRLCVEPRPVATAPLALASARASSHAPGHAAADVLTDDPLTTWRPAPGDGAPWLTFDLGSRREWGGLVVDVASGAGTPAMRLDASDDGTRWTRLVEAPAAAATRCWLRTTGAESRYVRLEFPDDISAGVAHARVVPLELAVSPARYAATRARQAPRGHFPRHLLDEQAYWAVVGADGDERKGLLGEDGALEVDAETFSLEPFLWVDDRLLTWDDAERAQALADGHLPVPSVSWRLPDVALRITAAAAGDAGASTLVARYEVRNGAGTTRRIRLYVAIRPYQVNPTWQSLNVVGGVAPLERLVRRGAVVHVGDTWRVVAVSRPDGFGAAPFEHGLASLAAGHPPGAEAIDDPIGLAEGVLWFDLEIQAGGTETVALAVPLHDASPAPPADLPRPEAAAWVERVLATATDHWRARLAAVPITLPPAAAPFADTLRAQLAWILVNRAGPRIQPGPRCYRRSWIRDGTLTGTALAELGFVTEAREFLRWYAPFQYDDGRVPCAVDRHGVDPVPEHDSHGQFVWGIVELFRLTGDRAFLEALWPRALRAVDAIAALRAERTTDAHRGQATFGLLPESISHEGYASRPVHAYWDDFFAVRALADAAWAAGVLGDAAAARIGALAEAMRRDLHASITQTMAAHGLDVLPGSVELGDFDPTSSAIALDPCGEDAGLPPGALAATFERYWAEFEARRRGAGPNDAYTPYEVRSATALLRLDWPARALEQLAWLIDDQRPPAWRQWPEIAWRDPRAPRFLGDLPHGWVASSFLRAMRRLIAYERDDDGVLVLGAGIPAAWVLDAPGVRVCGLPTHFGRLDFTMCADGDDQVVVRLGGTARPPGGFVVTSPDGRPIRDVLVDGETRAVAGSDRVHLAALAAEVRLRY